MALLTVQRPTTAGYTLTYASVTATTGDTFLNTGREVVSVSNGSGAPIDVTVKSGPASVNVCSFGVASAQHDLVVSIADGVTEMIGPFSNKARFNKASDNTVTVICSDDDTVTIAALSIA